MANDNISAVVRDGVLQSSTASSISLSSETKTSNSSLDKDAFLQLLVAQMKYQDPLEPTDNTEYVAQLATFSELEEMQNLSSTMSFQRASGLVGQEVVCKVTNASTGATEYVQGIVDYVVYEGSKAYLSIDESLYNVDDVYQVMDAEYSAAYNLAQKFVSALANFPKVDDITLEYEDSVKTMQETYNAMNSYQRSFLNQEVVDKLAAYVKKIEELKSQA
ncbi:MAG: flagellar hook capping protein [Lachnospiraceae bacterium]|nr:flagellar hook capping protein [Lachnospiraceae bacterium]